MELAVRLENYSYTFYLNLCMSTCSTTVILTDDKFIHNYLAFVTAGPK